MIKTTIVPKAKNNNDLFIIIFLIEYYRYDSTTMPNFSENKFFEDNPHLYPTD